LGWWRRPNGVDLRCTRFAIDFSATENYLHYGLVIVGRVSAAELRQASANAMERRIEYCQIQAILSEAVTLGIFRFGEAVANQYET
jgi:hypothetical protein